MRTAFAALLTLVLVSSSPAFDIETDVEWFDFSAWDHDQAAGGGQVLTDVWGDVDLTAEVSGELTLPSVIYAGGAGLVSQNALVGSQTFDFELSAATPLIVRYMSTDEFEEFDLVASDILNHTHTLGALPVVSDIPGGKRVTGSAHFMDDFGAARGYFELGAVTELSITHSSLLPLKYEEFQIGVLVPEPGSVGLALLGLVGFFVVRRQ